MSVYRVIIDGFKTDKQAKEFLNWYEGCGEQQFYDHLDMVGLSPDDGCNINIFRVGNTGRYYDTLENGYYAEVE